MNEAELYVEILFSVNICYKRRYKQCCMQKTKRTSRTLNKHFWLIYCFVIVYDKIARELKMGAFRCGLELSAGMLQNV